MIYTVLCCAAIVLLATACAFMYITIKDNKLLIAEQDKEIEELTETVRELKKADSPTFEFGIKHSYIQPQTINYSEEFQPHQLQIANDAIIREYLLKGIAHKLADFMEKSPTMYKITTEDSFPRGAKVYRVSIQILPYTE